MVGLYLIYQTHENVSSDLRWSQPGGQMTDLGLLEKGLGSSYKLERTTCFSRIRTKCHMWAYSAIVKKKISENIFT